MKNFYRNTALLIVASLVPGGAAFATEQQITQTATFGTHSTDVSGSTTAETFNDFLSAGAPANAVLDSAYLQLQITEQITGLSITDTASTTQSFAYYSTAQFLIGGSAPDVTNLNATLPSGPVILYSIGDYYGSGDEQSISAHATLNYIVGSTQSLSSGVNATYIGELANDNVKAQNPLQGNGLGTCTGNSGPNCIDLTPFTYTASYSDLLPSAYSGAGTFTLNYQTSTPLSFTAGGGNDAANQTTVTSANYEVIYNYHLSGVSVTPEPASMLLMGTALLGLGALGRRSRRSRS